jgi:hypothetical protein
MSFPFDLHIAAVSDSHLPCHAHAMLRPCRSSQGHSTALSEHGMASVKQTRSQCVNQMGKTYSKPLAARHGSGNGMGAAAWARHAVCESALKISYDSV